MPAYTHPKTGEPITPVPPEVQLAWTGGQPLGGWASLAGTIGNLLPESEIPPWRTSTGDLVIQINGEPIVVKDIVEYVSQHPEHTTLVTDPASLVRMKYARNLQTFTAEPRIRSIDDPTLPWGRLASHPSGGVTPTTYREAKAPATRYRTQLEQAVAGLGRPPEERAYARYEPAWYEFLGEKRPTARYRWMEKMFPELIERWEATQPMGETEFRAQRYAVTPERYEEYLTGLLPQRYRGEAMYTVPYETEEIIAAQRKATGWAEEQAKALARIAAAKREASWAEYRREYPWERQWSALSPEERGWQWKFQPKIRQYGR